MTYWLKNRDYLKNLKDYEECVEHYFRPVRDNHQNFDSFLKSGEPQRLCGQFLDNLRKIASDGGLDYDKFSLDK
jgi:hypothetical protein